jgi:aminobenzoyl-glutamate transport protein
MLPARGRSDARPRRFSLGVALDGVERLGNALPNPATLFLLMAALVLVASAVTASLGVTVLHPKDGSAITAVNLLSRDGVRRMFTEAVKNFVGFAPLGTVLVAMIGIGVAEATGLIAVLMRAFVMSMPRSLLTAAVVFTGVMANQAADAGIILLPPLGALLFAAAGRHPLAGLAAAFAGVSGGFSANLLPSTLDVLLAGFTQEAVTASKLLPGYHVQMLGNYWFMAVATPLLTVLGTWITHRFVEPRLGHWKGESRGGLEGLAPGERKGLIVSGIATLATALGFAALVMPGWGPLRIAGANTIEQLKPFFDSMVTLVLLAFFVPGLAYGIATGKIRSDHDVMRMTSDTVAGMAGYIVLAFCAAQFVNYFAWSNLGSIVAIGGAQFLRGLGLQGGALLVGFVVFAATLNLFITSASAKWAIVASIFVPMFALLGFTPEATQAVFRVGDSSTNIVTPLLPYMPFILAAAQRYDPKAGTGTLITLMLPYSVVFLVMWTSLLLLFYTLGWDIGPGVGMRLR